MIIKFAIETTKYENVKNEVLTKFFISENPVLTKYVLDSDEKITFAKFESEFEEDIEFVLEVLKKYGLHESGMDVEEVYKIIEKSKEE